MLVPNVNQWSHRLVNTSGGVPEQGPFQVRGDVLKDTEVSQPTVPSVERFSVTKEPSEMTRGVASSSSTRFACKVTRLNA